MTKKANLKSENKTNNKKLSRALGISQARQLGGTMPKKGKRVD